MVKFGNGDAFIINDFELKTKIIDYIFSIIDLSKYKYTMLENTNVLNFLKTNEHYVSPNYKGFNYFLLFYKFENVPHCLAIDKKNLTYNRKTIDMKKVLIYKFKCMASPSIFRGSLFDVKMLTNTSSYVMLIKDCFYVMGNDIVDMEMNDKMIYLDNIFAHQFQKDGCMNFKMKINKLHRYNMLLEIVSNIIPKSEFEITGLVFYPKKSGVSCIYTDKKVEKQAVNNNTVVDSKSYNMIHEIKDFLMSRTYSYENEKKRKVLTIEPTEISDVYDVIDNDERIGIAHIPNYKTSVYCRENIKTKVKCNCVFSKQFNKWVPVSVI